MKKQRLELLGHKERGDAEPLKHTCCVRHVRTGVILGYRGWCASWRGGVGVGFGGRGQERFPEIFSSYLGFKRKTVSSQKREGRRLGYLLGISFKIWWGTQDQRAGARSRSISNPCWRVWTLPSRVKGIRKGSFSRRRCNAICILAK